MTTETAGTTPQHPFFYYNALNDEEKAIYEQVHDLTNLDHEILLLRIKINHVLKNEPLDISILSSLVVTHNRLVKTNCMFFGGSISPINPRTDESRVHYLKRLARDTSP